jgi:hypothetical protein
MVRVAAKAKQCYGNESLKVVGLESKNGNVGIDQQGEVMREDDTMQCGHTWMGQAVTMCN